MWMIIAGSNDGDWKIWDGLGCELSLLSSDEAESISKYFNDNFISGRGLLDDYIKDSLNGSLPKKWQKFITS